MAVRLNHTIVAAHDHEASSKFLTEILGLPPPLRLGPFAVVPVGDTSLGLYERLKSTEAPMARSFLNITPFW
jgi:hypothetical protein